MKNRLIVLAIAVLAIVVAIPFVSTPTLITALTFAGVIGLLAEYRQSGEKLDYTPTAAVTAGTPVQLADGRAGVPANDIAAAKKGSVQVCGVFKFTKTSGVVILDGGKVFWDYSASAATFRKVNDQDYYLGVAVGDAASADTSLLVALNVEQRCLVDVAHDPIDSIVILTAGTPQLRALGGAHSLQFSATAEAQKVDVISKDAFALAANAIIEGAIEIVDNGDAAALDLNVGIANATHASDADSITESCFIHVDGSNLNILAESDDGTTEVGATDTTIDYVEGTRFEFWMDLRDPADVQIYIDGALILGATVFDISAATGPLKLLAHLEKSSDDTPGEVHVDWLRARIAEQ